MKILVQAPREIHNSKSLRKSVKLYRLFLGEILNDKCPTLKPARMTAEIESDQGVTKPISAIKMDMEPDPSPQKIRHLGNSGNSQSSWVLNPLLRPPCILALADAKSLTLTGY